MKINPGFGRKSGPSRKISFKSRWRNLLAMLLLYLLLAIIVAGALDYFARDIPVVGEKETATVALTQVVQDIKANKIARIVVEDQKLTIFYHDGSKAVSRKDTPTQSLISLLSEAGVKDPSAKVSIEVREGFFDGALGGIIGSLVQVVVFFLIILFVSRLMVGGGAEQIFSIGKSTAKLFGSDEKEKNHRITFDDAAGVEEAKQELREVVDFLKNPQKYQRLGARIPKGVLLVGPAGVGKTLLVKAVANEAGVPFYSMAGSEFIEILVGVGASRVRDLFQKAKQTAPALIFIDEIETIGKQRGMVAYMSHGEQEQTLNQILTEMDGFTPNDNVIVIAATNRPDILDPALTRPGRFDRRITLQLPDIEGRKGIIKIHMRNKPLAEDIDLDVLAKRTVGFSGADIENMLNEAAIMAAREGKDKITRRHLEEAATKVKLGPEKRRLQSEEDKRITAYHEAGHTVVAYSLPHVDPVHRVSIVARGFALGFTQIVPEQERFHHTRTRLLEQIAVMLGGRAAEELVFNDMTVGAGNDLEQANLLAKKMVTEFGMSELGPLSFAYRDPEAIWEGRLMAARVKYSEEMAAKIDTEIQRIIGDAYRQARQILLSQRVVLDRLAKRLVEVETVEHDELEKIMKSDI